MGLHKIMALCYNSREMVVNTYRQSVYQCTCKSQLCGRKAAYGMVTLSCSNTDIFITEG